MTAQVALNVLLRARDESAERVRFFVTELAALPFDDPRRDVAKAAYTAALAEHTKTKDAVRQRFAEDAARRTASLVGVGAVDAAKEAKVALRLMFGYIGDVTGLLSDWRSGKLPATAAECLAELEHALGESAEPGS